MTGLLWIKYSGERWCPLADLDLSSIKQSGVYVIWHGGHSPRVVYVGQGDVAARLACHRASNAIMKHAASGTLYVTWAVVPAAQRDGIERYLADRYSPLEGSSHPAAYPIAANGPWG